MHVSYSAMAHSTTTPDLLPMGWTFSTALKLGRVSNLPTVWTNVLAAIILSGSQISLLPSISLMMAMSLAYVGGMFLNDAFDHVIDAIERPNRPIPMGLVSTRSVYVVGFSLLLLSQLIVIAVASYFAQIIPAAISGLLLCAAIVSYNRWHKNNPLSPVLMGFCRLLVYSTCALSVSTEPSHLVYFGSITALAYLIGLTYTAKQEHLGKVSSLWPLGFLVVPVAFGLFFAPLSLGVWVTVAVLALWISYCLRLIIRRQRGDIPKAVTGLIAGIALVDMLLITVAGTHMNTETLPIWLVSLPFIAFSLTLFFQRYIAGT